MRESVVWREAGKKGGLFWLIRPVLATPKRAAGRLPALPAIDIMAIPGDPAGPLQLPVASRCYAVSLVHAAVIKRPRTFKLLPVYPGV
ncbi:MAG: hypothetical protein ACLP1D_14755 [Xanthobacteraceae bacterium]